MPMSLKCMIDKWLHKGQISQEEYDAVIKKLEGHDKQIREEVVDLIDRHLWNYSHEVWEDFKLILEQLKGAEK